MMKKNNAVDPEKTGPKQDTRFKPGQSGNPAGRPKGARSRLGEQFIQALADDFEEHGEAAIKTVRTKDPVAYVKILKDVMPREILLKSFNVSATMDLSAMEEAQGRLAAYKYARDFIGSPLIEAQPEGIVVSDGWKDIDDD